MRVLKNLIVLWCAVTSAWPLWAGEPLTVCSFNIKFLGHYKNKDTRRLAALMSRYDVVVVQELVAPPVSGNYPDGLPYNADPEAARFFSAMAKQQFAYWLSEEDTGPRQQIHKPGTSSEWFVVFYRTNKVQRAPDLPSGFLATDRSANPSYDRVPYAFALRAVDKSRDLVLISVHLHADSKGEARRKNELAAIATWIGAHNQTEKDFLVLGDMNFQGKAEFEAALPVGLDSLNKACLPTNLATEGKPYDHVLFGAASSPEVEGGGGFKVVSLKEYLDTSYPSLFYPKTSNGFAAKYSDHNPVVFQLQAIQDDD